MADYVVNIAIDAVIDALKAFILPFYWHRPIATLRTLSAAREPRSDAAKPCIVLTEFYSNR